MTRLGFPLEDPTRLDELIHIGAKSLQRAAPGPDKQLASATGVDRSRANRAKRGDRHSGATHYLRSLAESPVVNAMPLAAEGLAVVWQAQIEEAETGELEARLRTLTERQHDIDRDIRRAQLHFAESQKTPDDHDGIAELGMLKVECGLEWAGIHRELAKRKRRVARLS